MNLTISLFGHEVLAISTDDDNGKGPGDCTSTPVGFVASHGDQRWEKGLEP